MPKMDILNIVKCFYIIESVNSLLANKEAKFEPFRHSHERWKERFDAFSERFIDRLALLLYDYTALVTAGELRHSSEQCELALDDPLWVANCKYSQRNICYARVPQLWSADSILKVGEKLFHPDIFWKYGYGGKKWYYIAKAGLMYKKVPNTIFIDHCVDLSHNGSIYFDKGAGIIFLRSASQYLNYLDLKFTISPQALLSATNCQCVELRKLLVSAQVLGILPDYISIHRSWNSDDFTCEDIYPQPIMWNTRDLQYKVYETFIDKNEDEDEDEDYDEEEEED